MCEAPAQAKRILVVDQGTNWLHFAANTLCEEGYEAVQRGTYDLSEGERYDLILLGCEVIREQEEHFIRIAREKNYFIAVAALDAFRSAEMRRGFLSGANDVLIKPLGRTSLVHDFQELMRFCNCSGGIKAIK